MKKVIIIGAGPAGITAANELLKDTKGEYDVTILEETERIGGISQTVRYNGNRMDIGGHRFFSKSDEVMNWWSELMPVQGKPSFDDKILGREKPLVENGPDPEKDDKVILVRDRVSRIYYNKHFFDYPVTMSAATIKNMGFLTTMKAGFSYLKSVMFKKPEDSLENFYINRFGKVLYSMFFEGYTEKLWGRHPSEISADWGSQRVKGLSIRAVLKDMFSKRMPEACIITNGANTVSWRTTIFAGDTSTFSEPGIPLKIILFLCPAPGIASIRICSAQTPGITFITTLSSTPVACISSTTSWKE